MSRVSADDGNLTAATRGRIIQRVLVDGWSPAQAAAAFGVSERQVVRWVAAYRRHGMATLRGDTSISDAPLRWVRRLRTTIFGMITGTRHRSTAPAHPAPLALPRRRRADATSRSGTERAITS
jgi:transposase-like protein